MKLCQTLILAGMLSASAEWAQSEQWLAYHTGTETRGYRRIKLTTNAPPGVALPPLSGQPYFARWLTPMDPSGGRWLCLERSRKSGLFDRLYFDSNGDGRLDDEERRADLDDGARRHDGRLVRRDADAPDARSVGAAEVRQK